MGKPHPVELRERVVAFVDEDNRHREAARHFRVSPKFVNDMIKLPNIISNHVLVRLSINCPHSNLF